MIIFEIMGSCSSKYGGMERFLFRLAKKDSKNKYVIIYDEEPESQLYLDDLASANVDVVVLDTRKYRCFTNMMKFIALLRQYKPNVAHFHFSNPYCIWGPIAKICGVRKLLKTTHGCIYRKGMQVHNKKELGWKQVLITYNGLIFNIFDEVLCVSKYVQNQMTQVFGAKSNFKYAYLGTEASTLQSNEVKSRIRKENTIPDNSFVVTSIMFASHFKGGDLLLEAISKLPQDIPFVVLLIGLDESHAITQELKKQAIDLKIENKIRWIGITDHVKDYLNITNLYVQPSRTEALSLAAVEALSYGISVIASNVGGLPEVANNIYPVDDTIELSNIINRYLINTNYHAQQSIIAHNKWISNFSLEKGIKYYKTAYK